MDKCRNACNQPGVRHKILPTPAVGLLFFIAVLLTRIPVLTRSVLDWDESLYFLMASQWRAGHLPYTVIWDNKPVGIYAIFALFQMVFGQDIFSMRFATVCFIAVLALAVFKITEILTQHRAAAWVAGAALVLCSLSNDGLSANTELFMACFTALAVWLVLASEWGLLAGVLLGCAFMVKYVAMFEAPAVFFLYVWRRRRVSPGALMVLGAALPLGMVILRYALAGKFQLWLDDSVLSNFRRIEAHIGPAALEVALHTQLWRWGTLYAGAAALLLAAAVRRGWREVFLAGWLLGGLVGVEIAKSFYDHYFLQILPVLCVIFGYWFAKLPPRRLLRAGFVLVMLALPALAAKTALRDATGRDVIRQVGLALRAQHPASVYIFDSQPIIYALAGVNPPTRYVLPSELTGVLLPGVAGVNPQAEVARILAGRPAFIVRRNPPPAVLGSYNPAVYALLDATLAAHYGLWRRYPGVWVYRLTAGR